MSYTQTEQGTFILSAGSSFSNVTTTKDDTDPSYADNLADESEGNLDIELGGGYLITDGLMLGLSVLYDRDVIKYEGNSGYEDEQTTTNLSLAPGVRYYFGESGAYGGVSYLIGSINSVFESTGNEDEEVKGTQSGLIVSGGYSFFVNDIIAFTPQVTYSMLSTVQEDGTYNLNTGYPEDLTIKTSGLGISFSINIHLSN